MANPESGRHAVGILIVDDHPVVRASLRSLLEQQPGMMVVGDAGCGAEALEIASREQPEIVLLDLCLRDESGMDLIPEFLRVAEEARILILTGVEDEKEHRRAIRVGASGVVGKYAAPAFLLKAIERVNAGELWLNRSATAALVSELRRSPEPPQVPAEAGRIARLTPREREIILLVAEGKKNKQIADTLCISDITVRHHLSSILSKLEVSDRVELLIFAYKNNLASIKA